MCSVLLNFFIDKISFLMVSEREKDWLAFKADQEPWGGSWIFKVLSPVFSMHRVSVRFPLMICVYRELGQRFGI